jgi:hypothetical protein
LQTTHIDDTDGSLRLIYWKGNDALKGAERKNKNAVRKRLARADLKSKK